MKDFLIILVSNLIKKFLHGKVVNWHEKFSAKFSPQMLKPDTNSDAGNARPSQHILTVLVSLDATWTTL